MIERANVKHNQPSSSPPRRTKINSGALSSTLRVTVMRLSVLTLKSLTRYRSLDLLLNGENRNTRRREMVLPSRLIRDNNMMLRNLEVPDKSPRPRNGRKLKVSHEHMIQSQRERHGGEEARNQILQRLWTKIKISKLDSIKSTSYLHQRFIHIPKQSSFQPLLQPLVLTSRKR